MADYDIAIVNLLGFGPWESIIQRGLPPDLDGRPLLALLDAVGQILLAGGEVVVLGHPEVSAKTASHFGRHWTSLPWWTGMTLTWEDRAGDHIEILVSESDPDSPPSDQLSLSTGSRPGSICGFLPYLRLLKRYEYALIEARVADEFQRRVAVAPSVGTEGQMEGGLRLQTRALARTRRGGAVASEHLLEMFTRPATRRPDGWTLRTQARIVLLPDAGISAAEAVTLILREAYGVQVPNRAPVWLADCTAPGEAPIREQIAAVRAEINGLTTQLDRLEANRERLRDVLTVLTASDEELEGKVRDILRSLGAEVEDPHAANKEDGSIRVLIDGAAYEGVLEVKSTQRSTFDEKGLRQLMDWVARARSRGRTCKGIFIGNHSYTKPPQDRKNPFSSSFRVTAAANDIAVVTVWTLLLELGRVSDGTVLPQVFWKRLFDTRGVLEPGL